MWCALRRLKGCGLKVASEMLERAAIPPRAALEPFHPLACLQMVDAGVADLTAGHGAFA